MPPTKASPLLETPPVSKEMPSPPASPTKKPVNIFPFDVSDLAGSSHSHLLKWVEFGARLHKWSQNEGQVVLETDEDMPVRRELFAEPETEEVDDEILAAIEKAEAKYEEGKKQPDAEKMPIGVGGFAEFPYKRTYCGTELSYICAEESPAKQPRRSPSPLALPPSAASDEPASRALSDNKENAPPSPVAGRTPSYIS